jgi:hypothetical protein
MNFSTLRKTAFFIAFTLTAGCSGESTSSYEAKTTFLSKNQIVAGLAAGYGDRTIAAVIANTGLASLLPTYFATNSGQYAFTDYPPDRSPGGDIFYAVFTDGTRLYSVWSGKATPAANVTEISTQLNSDTPTNVTVSPDNFNARANINPITDLAYRYWLYEGQKSPYSDYLTKAFLFLQNEFDEFSIPDQNAVHDYPSPALLHLFKEVQIKVATDAAGFSLVNSATGKTRCTGTFALFPVCN